MCYVRVSRTRKDLYANITPDYYGYGDDEAVLEAAELEREKVLRRQLEDEYQISKKRRMEDFLRSNGAFDVLSDSEGEDLEAFDREMRADEETLASKKAVPA